MTKTSLPFIFCYILFTLVANAQKHNPRGKIIPQIPSDNPVLQSMAKSRLFLATNSTYRSKPNTQPTSVKAITLGLYSSTSMRFEYEDSVRVYWHDTLGVDYDYTLDLEILPQKPYETRNPREIMEYDYLDIKTDSILAYSWNDTIYGYENLPHYKEVAVIDNNYQKNSDTTFNQNGTQLTADSWSEYIYDTTGKLIEIIYYEINDTSIVITGKDTFDYDINGNLTLQGYCEYNNATFELMEYYEYEYDANDVLIRKSYWKYNFVNIVWVEIKREDYTYDTNDNLLLISISSYIGTTIESFEQRVFEYDGNNNLLHFIDMNWNDANQKWDTFSKNEYTYDVGIMPKTEIYSMYQLNGNWKHLFRYNYYYNSLNDLDTMISETHTGSNFEITYRIVYLRNEHNQIENIISHASYNKFQDIWSHGEHDVFYTFYYDIDTTGNNIKSPKNTTLELNIFPNPATNQLTINTGSEKVNAINIYDNMGRIVKQQRTKTTQKEITISTANLSNGTYTVQVVGDKKQGSKQVVIAR